MSAHRCDVLVVGGGPAGSTCAWALRRAGADVVLLDRAVFPRDKPCAGWVTPPVLDALELDLDEYRQGRVLQPIRGFVTSVGGGARTETRYDGVVSYGILRCEFDRFLLQRSRAYRCEGTPLRSLRRAAGGWIANEEWSARMVVGAGGHFCPVAGALGAVPGVEPAVVAQEVELRMDERQQAACPVDPEAPELFFCGDLRGYGWCVRKQDALNVGFGRLDRADLAPRVRQFVSLLRSRGTVPADLPARFKGHAYLVYPAARRRLVHDGALLVGDAAGLAYSASGEGIRPAVESGLLAARTILAARGRRFDDLAPYAAAVEARFGRRRAGGPSASLPWPLAAWIGRRLLSSSWATRRVVLDRLFLHADDSALPAVGRTRSRTSPIPQPTAHS
jgi:flavin-dependent dehydrogenase